MFQQTARSYLERHSVGHEADVFGLHERYFTSKMGAAFSDPEADRVREILTMVEESDIDEVVIEEGELKVTVRKAGGNASQPAAEAEPAVLPTTAASAAADDAGANGYQVMRYKWVATFYRAP